MSKSVSEIEKQIGKLEREGKKKMKVTLYDRTDNDSFITEKK